MTDRLVRMSEEEARVLNGPKHRAARAVGRDIAHRYSEGITPEEAGLVLEAATKYDVRLPQDTHRQPVEDKLRSILPDPSQEGSDG